MHSKPRQWHVLSTCRLLRLIRCLVCHLVYLYFGFNLNVYDMQPCRRCDTCQPMMESSIHYCMQLHLCFVHPSITSSRGSDPVAARHFSCTRATGADAASSTSTHLPGWNIWRKFLCAQVPRGGPAVAPPTCTSGQDVEHSDLWWCATLLWSL